MTLWVVTASYHHAKFGGYELSGNIYTMVFVCHMALQDHVIKVLYAFMERSASK